MEDEKLAKVIEQAVINALNRGASENKYIDVGRIPFICDDIRSIKTTLDAMERKLSSFPLIKLLVFGFVGIILVGVMGVAGDVIITTLSHTK